MFNLINHLKIPFLYLEYSDRLGRKKNESFSVLIKITKMFLNY